MVLADYILTLVHQGKNDGSTSRITPRYSPDTAKLMSPPFLLNSPGCLRAKVYTPGNLRLDVWYKTDASVENVVVFDIPLTEPPLQDPFFWADVVTDLRPVNEETIEYRLVFTITVDSFTAYYPLVLDSVVLDPGPCSARVAQGMTKLMYMTCSFR